MWLEQAAAAKKTLRGYELAGQGRNVHTMEETKKAINELEANLQQTFCSSRNNSNVIITKIFIKSVDMNNFNKITRLSIRIVFVLLIRNSNLHLVRMWKIY